MTLLVAVYVPAGSRSRPTAPDEDGHDEGQGRRRRGAPAEPPGPLRRVEQARRAEAGRCAVGLYDNALVEGQPTDAHIRRFEEERLADGDDVETTATKLHEYLRTAFDDARVGFYVAGYRVEDRERRTCTRATRRRSCGAQPERRHDRLRRLAAGDNDVANRLIRQESLPAFDAMPLQDAVDYAVRSDDDDTLRFEPRHPAVGGPIDVMTVTPEGCSWIRRKEVTVADDRPHAFTRSM